MHEQTHATYAPLAAPEASALPGGGAAGAGAAGSPYPRLAALVRWLGLSLSDCSNLTQRVVSRSSCHRILRGERRGTARERAALYAAILRALAERDSAFLFEDEA